MTQPLKQDERVLDYIYGELPEGERSSFESELADDAALRAEVDSLKRVRTEFRGLPKPTQSAESVSRMTAMLMQQAAQVQGGRGPADGKAAEAQTAHSEGAKLLPFRKSSLRRIFTSPASGIFAAAAAALFWVVLKSQTPLPSAPSSELKLEPAKTVAVLERPAVMAKGADPATAEGSVQLHQAFDEQLRDGKLAKDNAPAAAPVAEPAKEAPTTVAALRATGSTSSGSGGKKLSNKDDLDSLLDSSSTYASRGGDAKPAAKPSASSAPATPAMKAPLAEKPMIVAMAPKYDKKAERADDTGRFVQPPPPEVAEESEKKAGSKTTVRQQMGKLADNRSTRIFEELANQELGRYPGGMSAPGGAPPPPPPAAAAAPPAEPESRRYAQNQAPAAPSPVPSQQADEPNLAGAGAPPAAEAQGYAQNSQHPANSYPPAGAAPRRVANLDNEATANSASALQTVQEQLRQGRCNEANASLSRLEQSFPATPGLAEARAQWQRTCLAQQINQQQAGTPAIQNPMPAPTATPAPAPPKPMMQPMEQNYGSVNRMSMPSPSKAQNYRAAKKAAPAKAKAADQKAADAY